MTYQITEEVKRMLQAVLDDCEGNKAELGRRMGIDPSYISKYLSGQVTAVQHEVWDKICRYIPELDNRPVVVSGGINGNGNAVGHSNVVVGGRCADVVEAFRRSALDAVMSSEFELEADAKIKIYNLIKSLPIVKKSGK